MTRNLVLQQQGLGHPLPVVVPILRISEQPLGMASAMARAIRILPSACNTWRWVWAGVLRGGAGRAPP